VRVVRTPDARVILDLTGRLAGRGAYLCNDAACFDTATRKRALEHALGVAVPADLAAQLATGPDGLATVTAAATLTTEPAQALSPRPDATPDTTPRGGAHGQK
jgi:hypothetical protein